MCYPRSSIDPKLHFAGHGIATAFLTLSAERQRRKKLKEAMSLGLKTFEIANSCYLLGNVLNISVIRYNLVEIMSIIGIISSPVLFITQQPPTCHKLSQALHSAWWLAGRHFPLFLTSRPLIKAHNVTRDNGRTSSSTLLHIFWFWMFFLWSSWNTCFAVS